MAKQRGYWLMKSEPGTYSIEDFERDGRTSWEGVRNFQARNFMRDDIKVGDLVLFYHSSTEPAGVVGVARVRKPAYPDPTQFDPKSPYYDPKSARSDPRWVMVDVEHVERFAAVVSLATMKQDDRLAGMLVVRKGQRLSVQPVRKEHFARVLRLAKAHTKLR